MTRDARDLVPLVYEQLRGVATRMLAGREVNSLQPTGLVHEAWFRLCSASPEDGHRFRDREHFCAVAAMAMRQILVDRARKRRAERHGGGWQRVTLTGLSSDIGAATDVDLLALDEALTELESLDPRALRLVELRFFGGLTLPEIARTLDVSLSTVEKEWRRTRAWLGARLAEKP